jgi:predicted NUDIX family NTP pyrophosphohydrolase
MSQRSASILLYRLTDAAHEVLLVHPWAKKDDSAWSIPIDAARCSTPPTSVYLLREIRVRKR